LTLCVEYGIVQRAVDGNVLLFRYAAKWCTATILPDEQQW